MLHVVRRLLVLAALVPVLGLAADAKNCGCGCCKGKAVCCCEPGTTATTAKSRPLRGVITAIHTDSSSLMVKHEEIPGVMPAMTMLFKVDAATLKAARKGDTITAQMSRQGDDWWLHDVKAIPAKTT